ncbi:hypothetical protein Fmac_008534 [Flemingia macrophylla]|uniref:Uncharacterized protein n=1 Tax=Flemingia macrophylla TaxID=520843 RepID=A0ABD1MXN2_9FABA
MARSEKHLTLHGCRMQSLTTYILKQVLAQAFLRRVLGGSLVSNPSLLLLVIAFARRGETCDLRTNPLEGKRDDGITNVYQTYGKKIPQQGIG